MVIIIFSRFWACLRRILIGRGNFARMYNFDGFFALGLILIIVSIVCVYEHRILNGSVFVMLIDDRFAPVPRTLCLTLIIAISAV
jgi:hypothetical protein